MKNKKSKPNNLTLPNMLQTKKVKEDFMEHSLEDLLLDIKTLSDQKKVGYLQSLYPQEITVQRLKNTELKIFKMKKILVI